MTRLLLVKFHDNNGASLKRKRTDNDSAEMKPYRSKKEIDLAFEAPASFKDTASKEKSTFNRKSHRLQSIVECNLDVRDKPSPTIVQVADEKFTVTVKEKTNAIEIFESFKYASLQPKIPITKLLKKYFVFDLDTTITNIQKCNRYRNDPEYEYYQLTKEQIELKFHVALQRGLLFHRCIEFQLHQRANNSSNNIRQKFDLLGSSLDDTFDRFYNEIIVSKLGLQLYRTEWDIIDNEYAIHGRIDAAFVLDNVELPSSTKEIYLFDWKCSSSPLLSNEGIHSALPAPLQTLADHVSNKYALQLALYQFILRRQGYDVRAMFVCRFDPMRNGFELVRVDETSLDELVMSILSGKN
jgi:hypothetical protein